MSQNVETNLDPFSLSGIDLTTELNQNTNAWLTNHSGVTRPSYALSGTIWIDSSNLPTNYKVQFFDGANDIELFSVSGGQANVPNAITDAPSDGNLYGRVNSAWSKAATASHLHTGVYEPVITTKNTAFNKNFGTAAGTVAQGNHDHPKFVRHSNAANTSGLIRIQTQTPPTGGANGDIWFIVE